MSVLETLLWLELIRLRAENVRKLQAGVEDFLVGLRSEFKEAQGCNPDGNRCIGHRMPPGWEEDLEERWRRIEEKWKGGVDHEGERNEREDCRSGYRKESEQTPTPRNYYLEAMLPDYNPNGGTWFGPMPGDPPRRAAVMRDEFIDPQARLRESGDSLGDKGWGNRQPPGPLGGKGGHPDREVDPASMIVKENEK